MKKIIIISSVFFAIAASGFAQSADEAIRYSQLQFSGTARGMGVAGAFSAVGADFTSVISNPAGLGLFRRSEVMITPRFEHIKTNTSYLFSNMTNDSKFNFNIGNVAGVFSKMFEDNNGAREKGKLVGINFGIGFNRLANFHSNRVYRSLNSTNSILSRYAAELEGTPGDQVDFDNRNLSLEAVSAYSAGLIEYDDSLHYRAVTEGGNVDQLIFYDTDGAIDELSLSVAANYDNKLYFGAYIGIPFLRYREDITYNESDAGVIPDFNSFALRQSLNSTGTGINFKMGMIYRANNWVRLGAAFHTPTFYRVEDTYWTDATSSFDTTATGPVSSPTGIFEYNLITPLRVIGSLGLIMKKSGFVSFDYEWVNYGNAKYDAGDFKAFEIALNNDIDTSYGSAHIFRVGAEYAIKFFRLRAGFANYGSPFKSRSIVGNADDIRRYYTGGFGFRLKKFNIDFAYVRNTYKNITLVVNDVLTQDDVTKDSFMFTLGYRF